MIEATCHCGAVRIEVAAAPDEVTDCNCSICRRIGGLWAYYRPAEVTILADPGATTPYIRADEPEPSLAIHHCRTCGCTTHWSPLDPAIERMGVNARLMEPAIVGAARVRRFDGADTWTELD